MITRLVAARISFVLPPPSRITALPGGLHTLLSLLHGQLRGQISLRMWPGDAASASGPTIQSQIWYGQTGSGHRPAIKVLSCKVQSTLEILPGIGLIEISSEIILLNPAPVANPSCLFHLGHNLQWPLCSCTHCDYNRLLSGYKLWKALASTASIHSSFNHLAMAIKDWLPLADWLCLSCWGYIGLVIGCMDPAPRHGHQIKPGADILKFTIHVPCWPFPQPRWGCATRG